VCADWAEPTASDCADETFWTSGSATADSTCSGYCLEAESKNDGSSLYIKPCTGSEVQGFAWDNDNESSDFDNGEYFLKLGTNSKCLKKQGDTMFMQGCNSAWGSMRWKWVNVGGGEFNIYMSGDTDCMTVDADMKVTVCKCNATDCR
jgi:hypothetical protein